MRSVIASTYAVNKGMRFARLVARGLPFYVRESSTSRRAKVVCKCDCGEVRVVEVRGLVSGKAKSCGCLARDRIIQQSTKHGCAKRQKRIPEYVVWLAMKQRCVDKNCKSYADYGGRGIVVCPRWCDSFEAFFGDMGPRPSSQHQIDRINNDGDYEPGNCRWVGRSEQCRNRRTSRMIECDGKIMTLAAWSELTGIKVGTLQRRISSGWSVKRALTAPVRNY